MGSLCSTSATTAADLTVKIHGMSASGNTMVTVLFAKDIGAGDLSLLDLMKGEQNTPEFLAKNPFHQIPLLESADGFCVAESIAILRYLARTRSAPNYYPTDPKLRARVDFAMAAMSSEIYSACTQTLIYPIAGFGPPAADQEKALKTAKEALDNFSKMFLGGGKFICGDYLTIADYKCIVDLTWMTADGFERVSGLSLSPVVKTYINNCSAAMPNIGCLTSMGGWSICEYLASKCKGAPDSKINVVGGESPCPPIVTGPAKSGETAMKIHGVPASSNAMSPILLAMDVGCGKMEYCDLLGGAQLKPEFLKMNAFHHVPTMETSDGFAIGETDAILRFIAENYAPELYPGSDPKVLAKIDWAMEAARTTLYKKLAHGVWYPLFWGYPKPADQAAANATATEALEAWTKCFLTGKKFVAGDQISIAEYSMCTMLYCVMQPSVQKHTGFTVPTRLQQYTNDFIASSKSSPMLESAGGWSIKEYAATKM